MNSSALLAFVVSAPLVVLLVFDLDVARIVRKAERVKPQIPFLTGVKIVVYGVCMGAAIAAVLGLNSAMVNLTGFRIIEPPIPFLLIYVAVVSGSVGLFMLRRRIKRIVPEVDA